MLAIVMLDRPEERFQAPNYHETVKHLFFVAVTMNATLSLKAPKVTESDITDMTDKHITDKLYRCTNT